MNWSYILVALTVLQALLVQSDKVIRVTPEVESHLVFLQGLDKRDDIKRVDYWREPSHLFQPVDIEVSEEDFVTLSSLLEADGIEFKVQIDDVQKLIEGGLETIGARSFKSGSWHSNYHNLDEILSKLNEYNSRSKTHNSIVNIGKSHEGREMKAIKIQGKYSSNKPVFFIECGIHAREWVSPATCMFIIDEMTQKYGNDSSVTALLDKMDFIILPVFNVDGYAYTWINPGDKQYRYWRKNRRYHSSHGCYGVDLNRNWGYRWGGTGTSSDPCHIVYRGSDKFSEEETVNVRDFLQGLADEGKLKGFIDFHAYSQMWFIPWGYKSCNSPDHYEQMKVAQAAANATTNTYGTCFQYGSSAAILYPASGGSEDWTYGVLGVKYSFSVELRDKGLYGFLLPADQIIPTGKETFEGLKALVKEMRV